MIAIRRVLTFRQACCPVPPGMTREQVAYWDQVFAKTAGSPEWKEILARNFWGDEYRDSAGTKAFLDADYRELRAILTDLGLAK